MILTLEIPSSSCLDDSSDRFDGLVVSGSPEALHISLATLSDILLKSFCRNLTRLFSLVTLIMFMRVPSSMPSGCGLISLARGGICSVALPNMKRFPSGSMKVRVAWGLTMAVCLRYSMTDCLPVTYRPFM